jgi:hypothetical protein
MTKRPDPRELVEQSEPMRAWQADMDALAAAERDAQARMRELEHQYAEATAAHKQAADAARAALQPEPIHPEPPQEGEQLRGFLHTLQLRRQAARTDRQKIIGSLAPVVDTAWEKTRPGLQGDFLAWLQTGEALAAEFVAWHKQLRECRSRRATPGPGGQAMRPAPHLIDLVRVYGIDPTFDPCAIVTTPKRRITRGEAGDQEENDRPEPQRNGHTAKALRASIVAGARQ